MSEAKAPNEALGEWMRVARQGEGAYEARLEDHFGSAQPGDLLARCALAALSEGGGALRSLHAEWLAPAPPDVPLALRLAKLGDGGRCEIDVVQEATRIARVSAGLATPAPGTTYQDDALPPGLPAPGSLPTSVEYARKEGWPEMYAGGPVEFRRVGPLHPNRAAGESSDSLQWLKLRAPLAPDACLETAALVFLATFYAHWEFERRIGGERFDHARFRPLAHTLWLHGALPRDAWCLQRASARVAKGGRALAQRELFTEDGALLASLACEALVAET
jgi:acyl-CoA thioesterase-2